MMQPSGGEVQRLEPPDHEVRLVRRPLHQRKAGEATDQPGQRDLDLLASQRRADAEVDAAAEADVRRIATTDVEAIGLGKAPRIALRATEQHRHLLTDGDALPGDL